MKMSKIKQLRELKRFECNLKSIYNRNQFFKRIYETNNRKEIDNECVVISVGENRNIFSGLSKEVVESLRKDFNEDVIDINNNSISIKNYWDILDTVKYLLKIIEYDLVKAFIESDRKKIEFYE